MRSNRMKHKGERQHSLAGRLLKGILLAIAGTAISFSLLFHWIVLNNSELLVKDGLIGQAEEVLDGLSLTEDGTWRVIMHEPMQTGYDAFYRNLKYRVLDETGKVLVSSEETRDLLMPFSSEISTRFTHRKLAGTPLSVATVPFRFHNRQIFIQTARSDRFADLAIEAIAPAVIQTSTVVGLCALFFLSLVVWGVTRHALRPLQTLSADAMNISPSNISTRLQGAGLPSEIAPMVEAFNAALDRVESGYQAQQRFLANAAHELKTPLALLRAEIELNESKSGRAYLKDIDIMSRLVQQLLQLTEATEQISYRFEQVNPVKVARKVRDFLSPMTERKSVKILVDVLSDSEVRADEGALFVLMKNLLENAVRHSPPDSSVWLHLHASGLEVKDNGAGIAIDHMPFLFERFWRDPTRQIDGAGLGLAIVWEIVRNHGWTVQASNGNNGGAIFRVYW